MNSDVRLLWAAALGTLSFIALPAHAASNNVYIGQTGITNVITIDQEGLSNQVGANAETLLLNQDGRDNTVSIKQFGWANAVATVIHAIPLNAPYTIPAKGINQAGNDNQLMLDQSDLVANGRNTIEAIYQGASRAFESLSNSLSVTQSAAGGNGEASHYIGEIVQLNSDAGFTANEITLRQTGGGAGIGNRIESVRHEGHGNRIAISQAAVGNEIGTVRQIGNFNEQALTQEIGNGNVIGEALQFGDLNRLKVLQSGNANYFLNVMQNNDGVAISGNVAKLVIVGDDNGGDGRGGLGKFATIAAGIGVAQASITQLGDDNDLSYTVSADVTGGRTTVASHHNLFSFYQDGSGNGIIGTAIGHDNEAAVRQFGDDNNLSFAQNGAGNVVAVTMDGQGNRADIDQSGTSNTARIDWAGSARINNNNALDLSFFGPLANAAIDNELLPGDVRQSGIRNSIDLRITDGSRNLVAFLQKGTGNGLTGSMAGNANQAVAIQIGSGNIAGFSQDGRNNHLIIQQ